MPEPLGEPLEEQNNIYSSFSVKMTASKKLLARKTRQKRTRARIHGTAKRPRLVVFRSNKKIYAQLIDDDAKKTLASANDLKEKNIGKKTESAKRVGLELAKKAAEKGINSCVFDRAGYKYHGRIAALADGARENGLKF